MTPAVGRRSLEIMKCGPGAVKWQVEAVHADRGTGHPVWFVGQGGGEVVHLAGVADVEEFLAARGLSGGDLVPLDHGLPDGGDGCE